MSERQQLNVLATDMDGTFIPLEGNEANRQDLAQLCLQIQRHELELIYVTGRHYDLVMDAVTQHGLPIPHWLICDVGTNIYRKSRNGEHELVRGYEEHLSDIVHGFGVDRLAEQLLKIEGLRLQESEKQGTFKLSYYSDAERLGVITSRVSIRLDELQAPYQIIASVDPFTGDGLIDLLPARISKEYALRWWVGHTQRSDHSVVFAGDSGNDLAALTAGYRSIVVANAPETVIKEVTQKHQLNGWAGRLYVAEKPATSGVLEGLNHFLDQTHRDLKSQ